MDKFQVNQTGNNYIELKTKLSNIIITNKSSIEVSLYLHQILKDDILIFKKVFYPPFDQFIQFEPLPSGKMIKVNIKYYNSNQFQQVNIFTYTKVLQNQQNSENQSYSANIFKKSEGNLINHNWIKATHSNEISSKEKFSTSQNFMKTVGTINKIQNLKSLEKTILAARKHKNVEQFVNPRKGLIKQKRDERFKRALLVTYGIQLFDQIYKYKQGNKMFQNDWFMGPFYSYEPNQKQLRKNKK